MNTLKEEILNNAEKRAEERRKVLEMLNDKSIKEKALSLQRKEEEKNDGKEEGIS